MTNTLESRVRIRKGLRLSEDEIGKIIDSYITYHGNASETAEQVGHSHPTVLKYWNKKGLKALGKILYRGFKSPLECFRFYEKTDEEHKGLTRYELSKKDSGLYRALIRHGQIDDASLDKEPTGRPSLSEKEIYEIVKVYNQTGQFNRTAEITDHVYGTISKYLRFRGVEIKENRGRKRRI